MGDRNTFPCRGCGKPFLAPGSRDRHEDGCPQVEPEDLEAVEDQDQRLQQAPNPEPEAAIHPEPDPVPEPRPDRKAVDFGSGSCRCCGVDVGSTTRKGLCYGCDLAGCTPDSLGCEHRAGGSSA